MAVRDHLHPCGKCWRDAACTCAEMAERLRWRLWSWLSNRRGICPAAAHSRVIWRIRDRSMRIDGMCRSDAARNGSCWCGKLKEAS